MTDLTRYPIGMDDTVGLALWCVDCDTVPPFWTEHDAAEQVTELCLANLVAIAEQHEQKYHGGRRHEPLTDEPCGVMPTPAGLHYLQLRRRQHPRKAP